jgi:hypothetical protein
MSTTVLQTGTIYNVVPAGTMVVPENGYYTGTIAAEIKVNIV